MKKTRLWNCCRAAALVAGLIMTGMSATANAAFLATDVSSTTTPAGAAATVTSAVYDNTGGGNWVTALGLTYNQLGTPLTPVDTTAKFVYFYEISGVGASALITSLAVFSPNINSIGFLSGSNNVFNSTTTPTGFATDGSAFAPSDGSRTTFNAVYNFTSPSPFGIKSGVDSDVFFLTSNQSPVKSIGTLTNNSTQTPAQTFPEVLTPATPLPATLGLLLSAIPGFGAIGLVRRRKNSDAKSV